MANNVKTSVELSHGVLNKLVTNAAFVSGFPGMQKFVTKAGTTRRRGCGGCGGRKAAKAKVVKKTVIDYINLKRHIARLPEPRIKKLKQMLGTQTLTVTVKQPNQKIVTKTI